MKSISASLAAILLCCSVFVVAQGNTRSTSSGVFTTEDVVALVMAHRPANQVIQLIQHNPGNYELSTEKIRTLQQQGVPAAVIDAMLNASRGSIPTPEPPGGSGIPAPSGITPAPAAPSTPIAPGAKPTTPAGGDTTTPVDLRLAQARAAQVGPGSWTPPVKAPPNTCSVASKRRIEVSYQTGSSTTSRFSKGGLYCFLVTDANALYDWAVSLNVTEPTGNPFDMLSQAIQTLSKFGSGGGTTKAASTDSKNPPPSPSCIDVSIATKNSQDLASALTAMDPKDSSGKLIYVTPRETQTRMDRVVAAFNVYEQSVLAVQTALQNASANCDQDNLKQAEDLILNDYPIVKSTYQSLARRLSQPDVIAYERSINPTATTDLVMTPSFGGNALPSKTIHFDAGFGILSSSAGFVLTELQARSYSSTTAPNPTNPTTTQNVLKVDDGSGIRPALVVLLTANVPQLNRHNFGLGVSAGPLFDISSGKADTSKFGFFGGLSLRITPWVFLTPGVHVGEFADFPLGFTSPGQVIPANTGTPNPVKRFTARFAFAITWKISDLGSSSSQNQGQKASTSTTSNTGGNKP